MRHQVAFRPELLEKRSGLEYVDRLGFALDCHDGPNHLLVVGHGLLEGVDVGLKLFEHPGIRVIRRKGIATAPRARGGVGLADLGPNRLLAFALLDQPGLQTLVERQVPVFAFRHFGRDGKDGQVLETNRIANDKFAGPGLLGPCCTWFSRLLPRDRRRLAAGRARLRECLVHNDPRSEEYYVALFEFLGKL